MKTLTGLVLACLLITLPGCAIWDSLRRPPPPNCAPIPAHLLADCQVSLLNGGTNIDLGQWVNSVTAEVLQECNPRLAIARRYAAAQCDAAALKQLQSELSTK